MVAARGGSAQPPASGRTQDGTACEGERVDRRVREGVREGVVGGRGGRGGRGQTCGAGEAQRPRASGETMGVIGGGFAKSFINGQLIVGQSREGGKNKWDSATPINR